MTEEEKYFYQLIGNRIRFYRTIQSLSQHQLAEKLDITYQQIQKYEKGVNRLSVFRLEKIASVLKVSYQDLYPTNINLKPFRPYSNLELNILSSLIKLKKNQITTVNQFINFLINQNVS